jgi:uncharacterized protein YecE (DUF72 family)
MSAEIRIGTQGWNYDGWMGAFYPPKTSTKEALSLYAKVFDTVEIDSTFYAIPAENSVRGWYEKTPEHFLFSVKLPSEITHKNRLRDSEKHLLDFTQRMLLLNEKLGSILIQLPPDFSPAEHIALTDFLKILPSGFKFSVEFRDPNWINQSILAELEEKNVALALTDGKWISREKSLSIIEQQQASFSYVRWMGPRELTDFSRIQIDRTKEFSQWKDAFQMLSQKSKIIFGYFNNHFQGHSPASSNLFKKLLGLKTIDPDSLIIQPSLF